MTLLAFYINIHYTIQSTLYPCLKLHLAAPNDRRIKMHKVQRCMTCKNAHKKHKISIMELRIRISLIHYEYIDRFIISRVSDWYFATLIISSIEVQTTTWPFQYLETTPTSTQNTHYRGFDIDFRCFYLRSPDSRNLDIRPRTSIKPPKDFYC